MILFLFLWFFPCLNNIQEFFLVIIINNSNVGKAFIMRVNNVLEEKLEQYIKNMDKKELEYILGGLVNITYCLTNADVEKDETIRKIEGKLFFLLFVVLIPLGITLLLFTSIGLLISYSLVSILFIVCIKVLRHELFLLKKHDVESYNIVLKKKFFKKLTKVDKKIINEYIKKELSIQEIKDKYYHQKISIIGDMLIDHYKCQLRKELIRNGGV